MGGAKVKEDIVVKEDDLDEFLEDESWEHHADQTQSMLDKEQSCLRDVVTGLPTQRMLKETMGLPVSDERSDNGENHTIPDKEEEVSNHIG